MLKCWAQLKEQDYELYKKCVNEGLKQPGSANWLVARTFGDLEHLKHQVEEIGIGFNPINIYKRLTVAERVVVDNLLRYTNRDKVDKWRSNHKINAQRSERWVKWFLNHQDDLLDLEKLQAKCNRKPPPNMDDQKRDIESLLN